MMECRCEWKDGVVPKPKAEATKLRSNYLFRLIAPKRPPFDVNLSHCFDDHVYIPYRSL